MEIKLRFLSPVEVAETLQLSKRFVNKLVQEGKLPAFNFGGQVRITAQDLQRFINQSRKGPSQNED